MQAGIAEASIAREAAAAAVAVAVTCDERDIPEHHPHHHPHTRPQHVTPHDPPPPPPPPHSINPHHQHHPHSHHHHHQQQQQQQQQQLATAAFHITRPSHSISTIIAPPSLHHTSVILDEDSFHVSRALMLQTESFQVNFFPFFNQSSIEFINSAAGFLYLVSIVANT